MAQMVIILLPRARVCIRRIQEVLETEPEICDGMKSAGEISPSAYAEDIVVKFDHVSFRFPDADEYALSDLDFICRRGETTAVIGGTGCGKSTLARLILRFYDVTDGLVEVNGMDVRDMTQNELRSQISYVPQKAWLFSGTIADNLRYGNEEAQEEEMRRILSVAQADFVSGLANGLDAHVAQGGTNYSGGQKQRLSIARALMKRQICIFLTTAFPHWTLRQMRRSEKH